MKASLRKFIRWSHTWLGLTTGVFICLMGFTGGVVGLRPQIATLLSPPARTAGCVAAPDWNRAAADVTAFAGSDINRIYGPYGSDTRYHFRMATDRPVIYRHVIYDACSGRVLGSIGLAWMDWTVDLHHNLLAGRPGRLWAGAIGIVMLVGGLSGVFLWTLTKPDPRTAFRIQFGFTKRTPRELHRAVGLGAAVLLALEAFTGLWLCFPQTMRGMLTTVAPAQEDIRPARLPRGGDTSQRASLGDIMAAARAALPDGLVREIRLPEGGGAVQVRMWRTGDFRSLGNNVVFLSASDARVLGVDRYADRSASNRFTQAMAGLHYDEWGGLPFRVLSSVAGLLTPVLFVSGIFLWWYSRPRGKAPAAPKEPVNRAAAVA
jgi:uncharacterized iron-regulated membrane protein